MQWNNDCIKTLVVTYRESLCYEDLHSFQKAVSLYVKYWPKQKYSCNEDICQEFVLYFLEHSEQILKSYPMDSPVFFLTWFNGVLYYKFCDFCKLGTVPVMDLSLDQNEQIHSMIALDLVQDEELSLEEIMDRLNLKDRSLLMFYYFPHNIYSENLQEIATYTSKDLQEILIYYQEVLTVQHENYQQKEQIYNKIKKIDHQIDHYENRIRKSTLINEEQLKQKILRLKNRQYKYMRTLKRMSNNAFKIFVKLFGNYYKAFNTLETLQQKLKKLAQENIKD